MEVERVIADFPAPIKKAAVVKARRIGLTLKGYLVSLVIADLASEETPIVREIITKAS